MQTCSFHSSQRDFSKQQHPRPTQMWGFLNQSDIYSNQEDRRSSWREVKEKNLLQARNLFDENDNFGFFLFIPSSFLISNGDDAKSGKGVICDDFYVRDVSLCLSHSTRNWLLHFDLCRIMKWTEAFLLFHSAGGSPEISKNYGNRDGAGHYSWDNAWAFADRYQNSWKWLKSSEKCFHDRSRRPRDPKDQINTDFAKFAIQKKRKSQ